jgi:Leucine-rich repeat (LRR) protein
MSDDAFLEFAVFAQLKRFRLQRTTITDAGLKVVLGLGMLEELQMTGSSVAGPGLEHLEERKGLKILDLSGSKLDDAATEKLLALPALREVRLAGCTISDQGVMFLAQIDNLQVLDLTGTRITDIAIGILKKHPTLKLLILTNTGVTAAAIADFERATPNCRAMGGAKR